MNGGSPMTPRNARTGEFTPPGNSVFARASSRRDRSVFRDDMAARFSAAARDGKEQREAVLPTVRAGLLRGSAPLRVPAVPDRGRVARGHGASALETPLGALGRGLP